MLLDLFLCFVQVGLFSIGGGYAAMPMIQAKAVEYYHWLTMSEFTDLMTIAEMTPGPITVNSATFVGIRLAGFLGAPASGGRGADCLRGADDSAGCSLRGRRYQREHGTGALCRAVYHCAGCAENQAQQPDSGHGLLRRGFAGGEADFGLSG